MKKILRNVLYHIIISWTIFYLFGFVWNGVLYNICLVFFCILGPICNLWFSINGFRKNELFKRLKISYESSTPCYAFLGLYKLYNGEYIKVKKNPLLTYSICLCSKDTLYFYECEKALMTAETFGIEICEDINDSIIFIEKNSVLRFMYTNLARSNSDKIGAWISNKVGAHIQSYFTNHISSTIHMEAIVEVYFTRGGEINVLTFGIPETMASSFSIDLYDFLPEVVGTAESYISGCQDILNVFEDDPVHVKSAKKMIRSLFYQITNNAVLNHS